MSFVPGTHFYRQKTKYTQPAPNPVPTTNDYSILGRLGTGFFFLDAYSAPLGMATQGMGARWGARAKNYLASVGALALVGGSLFQVPTCMSDTERACLCLCVGVCVCLCVCLCLYMCLCVCIRV